MARWLHTLQQFQYTIVHRAGRDHSNVDGLSRVPTSPCGQCTRVDTAVEVEDQPFDAESVGDSEDADLVPIQSGEDWVAQLDDDLSRPATRTGEASTSALCNSRIPRASRCWNGYGLLVFLPGRK